MTELMTHPDLELDPLPASAAAAANFAKRMHHVTRLLTAAGTDLTEKVTHDLRVAIRRCRSVAHGAAALDPDGPWGKASKELRRVFRALGHLRDLHVMQGWVERLGKPSDPVRDAVSGILRRKEPIHLEAIRVALDRFDSGSWEEWGETLPNRLQEVLNSHPLFADIALQRFHDFLALHREMISDCSEETWHRARVALKRFRYTVEDFLPDQYKAWEEDLEILQDLLGEIHDLDVLGAYLLTLNPLFEPVDRKRWRRIIQRERKVRVKQYQRRTGDPNGLWERWSKELGGPSTDRADVVQTGSSRKGTRPRFALWRPHETGSLRRN